MRIAFDSNILIYLAGGCGPQDEVKVETARAMYSSLLLHDYELIAPVQVLGEAFRALSGKFHFPGELVIATLAEWENSFEIAPTTVTVMREAVRLAVDHRLQIWDSVILAAASEAECLLLCSEDMQNGFVWRGLTIVNPFADPLHPLLASLLDA